MCKEAVKTYRVEGMEQSVFDTLEAALAQAEQIVKEDGHPCWVAAIVARVVPEFTTKLVVEWM